LLWVAALLACARHLRASVPPSLGLFLLMGWVAVVAALPVALRAGTVSLACLLLGAAVYSAGTVFYRNKSGWAYGHGVWHLFVVAGTAWHFGAVMYLVP